MTPGRLADVVGVSRRALRIHSRMTRGRLIVTVDVPPGGGAQPVRIAYSALRRGHVVARAARRVSARHRVARVTFRLGFSARGAGTLRVTARQGSARATRLLSNHQRRASQR
jgi:hypothetical protein